MVNFHLKDFGYLLNSSIIVDLIRIESETIPVNRI